MEKLVVVIEGPSGVGKDTVIKELIKKYPKTYKKAPSMATRQMRDSETQGDPYFFITEKEFKEKISSGEICEHTKRHGSYRGISLPLIDAILNQGLIALKDADLVGVRKLREVYGTQFLAIFVKANKQDIKKRLKNRGDSEKEIQIRLEDYDSMMETEPEFNFSVENNIVDETVNEIHSIIQTYLQQKRI